MLSGEDDVAAGGVLRVLLVVKPDPESDRETGERLTRQLRAELAELDVDSVAPVPGGPAPDGAKGADAVALGAIVVALSASGGVLTALVDVLRDWLSRQAVGHRISVTIDGDTIQLEGGSTEQQQALVDAYLQRHSGQRAG
jgi:hypothetical protein